MDTSLQAANPTAIELFDVLDRMAAWANPPLHS